MTPAVYEWFGTVSTAMSAVANYVPAGVAPPAAPPGANDIVVCNPANIRPGAVGFDSPTVDAAFAAPDIAEFRMMVNYVGDLFVTKTVTINKITTNEVNPLVVSQRIALDPGVTLYTTDANFNGGEVYLDLPPGGIPAPLPVPGGGLPAGFVVKTAANGQGQASVNAQFSIRDADFSVDTNAVLNINAPLGLKAARITNIGKVIWTAGAIDSVGTSSWTNETGDGFVVSGVTRTFGANVNFSITTAFVVALNNANEQVFFASPLSSQSALVVGAPAPTFVVSQGVLALGGESSAVAEVEVGFNGRLSIYNTFSTGSDTSFTGDGVLQVYGPDGVVVQINGADITVETRTEMYGGGEFRDGTVRFDNTLLVSEGVFTNAEVRAVSVTLDKPANVSAVLTLHETDIHLGQTFWMNGAILVEKANISNEGLMFVSPGTSIGLAAPFLPPPDTSTFLNTTAGTVTFMNGATQTALNIAFENMGTVDGNGSVKFWKGLKQSGGVFVLPGKLDLNGADFEVTGGSVNLGHDIDDGNFKVTAGNVYVPTAVNVKGNLVFAGGQLTIAIWAGGNASITATGTASLGGSVAVDPAVGYIPVAGTKHKFLTATGGIVGAGAFAAPPGWKINALGNDRELEKLGPAVIGAD